MQGNAHNQPCVPSPLTQSLTTHPRLPEWLLFDNNQDQHEGMFYPVELLGTDIASLPNNSASYDEPITCSPSASLHHSVPRSPHHTHYSRITSQRRMFHRFRPFSVTPPPILCLGNTRYQVTQCGFTESPTTGCCTRVCATKLIGPSD